MTTSEESRDSGVRDAETLLAILEAGIRTTGQIRYEHGFTPDDCGWSFDEGEGMLISELLDESTLEYVRKRDERRKRGEWRG
jgi:hypothetical protein